MGVSTTKFGEMNNSDLIDLTGKITVVAILLAFVVLVFVFLLQIYAKWYWNRRREELSNSDDPATTRRRSDYNLNNIASRRQGLDPSMLKTIPVVIFSATDFKEGLECAVCLCDVSEGEKIRFLPICNHGFHVNCIDMWFQSHSSCPICRNFVTKNPNLIQESTFESTESPQIENSENHNSESPRNFPTNVLFWGNDVEVRTLGTTYTEEDQEPAFVQSSTITSSSSRSSSNRFDGVLVIDIPQQDNEHDEELKSPVPTRLGSLKRLLSRDSRRVGTCSPRDVDVEQAIWS